MNKLLTVILKKESYLTIQINPNFIITHKKYNIQEKTSGYLPDAYFSLTISMLKLQLH